MTKEKRQKKNEYMRNWCRQNKDKRRLHLLKYYYSHKIAFNFTKPGKEDDAQDEYLAKQFGKTWF
jgi:hypothetical protein